jgi:hypothetical protein
MIELIKDPDNEGYYSIFQNNFGNIKEIWCSECELKDLFWQILKI